MRVPDSMLYRMHRQQINQSRSDIAEAQLQAATGIRVHKPSDDPLGAAQIRGFTSRIEQAEATLRNIESTTGRLQLSEATISEATALISRATELAVQQSNDTFSADDREATALEIRSIQEQLRTLANTEHNGEYLFAGFQTDTPPYDNAYVFQNDTNIRQIEVAPGHRVDSHVNGSDIFGGALGAVAVFDVVNDVAAAMEANDPDTLRQQLDRLEASHEQLVQGRARVGTLLNRFEVSREVTLQTHDRALIDRQEVLEADPIEAAQNLVQADVALQAAITIASRLPLPGLLGRG